MPNRRSPHTGPCPGPPPPHRRTQPPPRPTTAPLPRPPPRLRPLRPRQLSLQRPSRPACRRTRAMTVQIRRVLIRQATDIPGRALSNTTRGCGHPAPVMIAHGDGLLHRTIHVRGPRADGRRRSPRPRLAIPARLITRTGEIPTLPAGLSRSGIAFPARHHIDRGAGKRRDPTGRGAYRRTESPARRKARRVTGFDERRKMAGVAGFEPAALGFGDRCSTN